MSNRVRILAFAYACAPDEGSEPGAGWALARLLAKHADVWVVTRENNRDAIERGLARVPERDRLHFVYVDLHPRMRFWKRGGRGVRLYYVLWQLAAVRAARRVAANVHPDVVWHLTLANAWLGSLAPLVGGPFVYGPVGGAVTAPWRLATALGPAGAVRDAVRVAASTLMHHVNPAARLARARAAVILAQNHETVLRLPRRQQPKARVLPNVVVEERPEYRGERPAPGKTAVFVGRLVAWKGCALAIRAVAQRPEWRLLVCGVGPDEARMRRLVDNLGVSDRVDFLGWLSRDEVLRMLEGRGDALLFPSLHDDAGWIVGEALSCGVPVVCIDRGGPPVLAAGGGVVVSHCGSVSAVAQRLAEALDEVAADAELPARARRRAASFFAESVAIELHSVIAAVTTPADGVAA